MRDYNEICQKLNFQFLTPDDLEQLDMEYLLAPGKSFPSTPNYKLTLDYMLTIYSINSLLKKSTAYICDLLDKEAKARGLSKECLTSILLLLLHPQTQCFRIISKKTSNPIFFIVDPDSSVELNTLQNLPKEHPELFVTLDSNADRIKTQPYTFISNDEIADIYNSQD